MRGSHYMLWPCIRLLVHLSVRPSVTHKSELPSLCRRHSTLVFPVHSRYTHRTESSISHLSPTKSSSAHLFTDDCQSYYNPQVPQDRITAIVGPNPPILKFGEKQNVGMVDPWYARLGQLCRHSAFRSFPRSQLYCIASRRIHGVQSVPSR